MPSSLYSICILMVIGLGTEIASARSDAACSMPVRKLDGAAMASASNSRLIVKFPDVSRAGVSPADVLAAAAGIDVSARLSPPSKDAIVADALLASKGFGEGPTAAAGPVAGGEVSSPPSGLRGALCAVAKPNIDAQNNAVAPPDTEPIGAADRSAAEVKSVLIDMDFFLLVALPLRDVVQLLRAEAVAVAAPAGVDCRLASGRDDPEPPCDSAFDCAKPEIAVRFFGIHVAVGRTTQRGFDQARTSRGPEQKCG